MISLAKTLSLPAEWMPKHANGGFKSSRAKYEASYPYVFPRVHTLWVFRIISENPRQMLDFLVESQRLVKGYIFKSYTHFGSYICTDFKLKEAFTSSRDFTDFRIVQHSFAACQSHWTVDNQVSKWRVFNSGVSLIEYKIQYVSSLWSAVSFGNLPSS